MKYAKQVGVEHYASQKYDNLPRFVSYFHQKDLVLNACSEWLNASVHPRVLEVGKGTGFLSQYLKANGVDISTFDNTPELDPDICGDLLSVGESMNESFHVVCCFEVLEHLEWRDVGQAIKGLAKISQKNVIISVPQVRAYFSWTIKVTKLPILSGYWSAPLPIKHKFDGEHYWELGVAGSSNGDFRRLLSRAGLKLCCEFVEPQDPYHRYFVCEKI